MVNMDDSVLFWSDAVLLEGIVQPHSMRFPRLGSYVTDDMISVKDFLDSDDPAFYFALPLSAEPMQNFQYLQNSLTSLLRDENCLMCGPD